ncbi:rhomboid family intramembrane serine protease [Evansella tamaricis]|uniref:Rhomboid family intramembrane serine protease n=1 Tax=Evansella tamaricis TaxID=2069301 RepID=A0ABS6JG17_9BACI|nr:rhomboid family intramembrane serine protease [Evansella tamaricis]MBU9712335.1 rhomboid family intramembrane serine protease [Evansella tamaricis]
MKIIDIMKKSPVTFIFFTISLIIFIIARLTDPENIRFLALSNSELPERWYTLITHGFVHVEPYHFILNMVVLIFVGRWVERLIGSRKYFVLTFLCILAGGTSIVLWGTAGIGFSAAGFGLLFYYYLAFPMEKELYFNLPNVVLPILLLLVSVIAIVFDLLGSVGHIPHLAGGIVGAICLFIFRKKHREI